MQTPSVDSFEREPRLEIVVSDMGGGRIDLELHVSPRAANWSCEPSPSRTTVPRAASQQTPVPSVTAQTTSTTTASNPPTLSELCEQVVEFMEGYSTGLRVTQCEVQDNWFIVQTNDVSNWTSHLEGVLTGDISPTAFLEMPAAAYSAALIQVGADPAQFDRYIFSLQDVCQTVIEYRTSDISAAVSAYSRGIEAWFEAAQDAWLNGAVSTLNIEGC